MRTPSVAALALLKEFEQGPRGGFASKSYQCPAGFKTIGWGHVIRPTDHFEEPIREAEADALLRADLGRIAPQIAAGLRNRPEVTQSMFDALVCLGFNIGLGALLSSTLMMKLRMRDWAGAAKQFLRWDKARNPKTGKKERLPGLTRRRQAERELFLHDGLPGDS